MTDATCTCLEKNGNSCTTFIKKNYIDWARRSKLHMHVIWEFAWSNSKIIDWLAFPHLVRCNKTKGRSPSSLLWWSLLSLSLCMFTLCDLQAVMNSVLLKWYVSQALRSLGRYERISRPKQSFRRQQKILDNIMVGLFQHKGGLPVLDRMGEIKFDSQ